MDFSIFPTGDVGTLAVGLMIAAAVAGLAAGTLRVGGGLVLVPALYIAMKDFGMAEAVRLPVAVATALAASIPATLSLLHDHWRKGLVDRAYLRRQVWIGVGAACFGAAAASFAPSVVGIVAFLLVALGIAVWLVFAKDDWRLKGATAEGRGGAGLRAGLWTLGTFCGIGAGTFAAAQLSLSGVEPKRAAAAATAFDAIGATVAAAAMAALGLWAHDLPQYSFGYVNLAAFAVAAPVMFLAATFVQAFADRARTAALRKIFALFVILSLVKLAMDWLG
jgi:uncharacterized protein